VSTFWDAGTIGRPDPGRQHRAQRLIERFHAGLIDGAAYLRELQALLAEEFAAELAGDLTVPAEAGRDERDEIDDVDDADQIRRMFPTRDDAPGLWLVLGDARCHFCGRRLPVLALKPSGDDPGGWVHLCLDDLELIRGQAADALAAGGNE